MGFLSKKTFQSVRETGATSGLSKTLGAFDLILFGLGGIIGTGVFVFTGLVAATYAGPAVIISYIIAGLTCIFVAFAYTELAAMLPTSGSVYTYSYVAFGEIFAWMISSTVTLELIFGAAAVSAGWSAYVQSIFMAAGMKLPDAISKTPFNGGIINLPAVFIIAFVGMVLYCGTKDSKRLNAILVFIKLAAIFAFIVAAVPHFDANNWNDFIPFGFENVIVGSSILFFAFTGFGNIATAAEECKNPTRDIMIGIIGSLVLSTIVYVVVAALLTGIIPYYELNNAQPLAHALSFNSSNIGAAIVATGAVCGMTTVIMMNIFGQSRIFYVIARDGLIAKIFSRLHPKYDSPYVAIIIFGMMAAALGAFFPYDILGKLSSMGALINYIAVTIAVVVFRVKSPDAPRPFRCPGLFFIAPIACLACIYLLSKQVISHDGKLLITGQLVLGWLVASVIIYILCTPFRNKKLHQSKVKLAK